jgi:ATP-dependent Lon protease
LRDRLEVVEVSGYATAEKMAIARDHLWPKELERHGLADSGLALGDEVLGEIIESYTSEAGCRDLCRHLRSLIRSRAVERAEGKALSPVVQAHELHAILGAPRVARETRALSPQIGVATGLAWTAAGGDLMFVEAVAMPGEGRLELTGQLGEVMRESAMAAVSFVRSRADSLKIEPEWFKQRDIHVHLPQGAIPKDGPSAGVSMAVALFSLMSGVPVRADLGLTGEISLRGLVHPVGGLKEKILAAKRAGLAAVAVPEKNLPDVRELPESLTEDIEIVPVKTVDEAVRLALKGGSFAARPFGEPCRKLAVNDDRQYRLSQATVTVV